MCIIEKGSIQFKDTKELKSLMKVIELWKKSAVISGFDEKTGLWESVAGADREEKKIKDLTEEEYDDAIPFRTFEALQKCSEIDFKKCKIEQLTLIRVLGSPSCYISLPPGPDIYIC